MIDSMAEYMKKIAKATRETPLDVMRRPRSLEQFSCMKKARLDSFFVC